jgi:hypothetical protein
MSIVGSHRRAQHVARVALAASGLVVACIPEQPRSEDAETLQALELREAVDGYRAWPRPAPFTERTEGSGAHGRFVELFASPEAAVVLELEADVTAWPVGSRFVLEGYDAPDATEPYVLGIMVKEDEGWRWAQFEGEEPIVYGRSTACVGCHLAGDDLVRSVPLPARED